jgi:hypothetical protein
MESPTESITWSEWSRTVEPWVLPAIAAVVIAGVLLLCALIGMFWLAVRPAQQPIVIWVPAAAEHAIIRHPINSTIRLEKCSDDRAN